MEMNISDDAYGHCTQGHLLRMTSLQPIWYVLTKQDKRRLT